MIYNFDDYNEIAYIEKEGNYTLKIIGVAKDSNGDVTQMTANGNEFHKYVCENQEHERINVTLYIIEKAMWKYKAFLTALGIDTKGFQFDTETFDPESLVGKKFVGEVRRQADKMNVETGQLEPSKYYEVAKFYTVDRA